MKKQAAQYTETLYMWDCDFWSSYIYEEEAYCGKFRDEHGDEYKFYANDYCDYDAIYGEILDTNFCYRAAVNQHKKGETHDLDECLARATFDTLDEAKEWLVAELAKHDIELTVFKESAMKKRAKGDFREECVEELHEGQYTIYITEFWYDGFPFPMYQYDIECPDGTWVYADDEYGSIQDCEDGARVEIAEIENETMMRIMLGSKKVVGYDYDDWLYDTIYEPDDDYYNYSARSLDDSVMPQTVSDFGTLVSGSVIYYELDANVCYSCSYSSYHTRYDNLCKPNYRRQYYAYVWGIYKDPDGYPFAICQQTLDGATSSSPAPTYVDVSNDYYSDYDGFDGNSPQEWIGELVEYLQDTNRGFTYEVLNSLPDEGEMVREWYEGYEDYKADNYDPYDDDRW